MKTWLGPVGVQGIAVDIERGLRQKHFPIRVRYILTSDTYAPKTVESEDWVEGKDLCRIYIYILPANKHGWLTIIKYAQDVK